MSIDANIAEFKDKLYARCNWDLLRDPELDLELTECLKKIWNHQILNPSKENILEAFVFTKPEELKVVIVGQDPYNTAGWAHGLAFSTVYEKKVIPPSLQSIYKCLLAEGLIKEMPNHGNLIPWAKRGVLLLNTQLTTDNQTNSHKFWNKYTDMLLKKIAQKYQPYFCLWGNPAKAKKDLIKDYVPNNKILEYRHPSPLSGGNWNCDHFKTLTENVGIDWEPYFYKIYLVATDGSCLGNGTKNAVGAVGVYFPEEFLGIQNAISGNYTKKIVPCTNNIAELTAIIDALTIILSQKLPDMTKFKVILLTDSEYSIKTIDSIHKDDSKYKNIDLRQKLRPLLKALENHVFNRIHVLAHRSDREINALQEPDKSFAKFNKEADRIASETARTVNIKASPSLLSE